MTKAEQSHKDKLSELGCALCYRIHGPHEPGPVTLHHLRTGGWGKGNWETLIPLCHHHHQGAEGIHTMGTKRWAIFFNVTQQELLDWVMEQVNA